MYIFVPISFDSVCQGVRCWMGVSFRCSEERENQPMASSSLSQSNIYMSHIHIIYIIYTLRAHIYRVPGTISELSVALELLRKFV